MATRDDELAGRWTVKFRWMISRDAPKIATTEPGSQAMRLVIIAIAFLLSVTSCTTASTTTGTKRSQKKPKPIATIPKDGSIQPHMAEHFAKALEVQQAVIAGELANTKEPAKWVAEHEMPSTMPKNWRPFVDAMKGTARQVHSAETLSDAAAKTAAMGKICGECHTATGAQVAYAAKADPPTGEDAKSHMRRHLWAADRMWDGLTGPSDEAWEQGAFMLAEFELKPFEADPDLLALAQATHSLGLKAVAEDSPTIRAEIMGEFLAGCAQCHTAVGVKPEL